MSQADDGVLAVDEEAAGILDIDFSIEALRRCAGRGGADRCIVVSSFKIEKGADAGIRGMSQPPADCILNGTAFFNEQPPPSKIAHAQAGRSRQVVKVAHRAAVDRQGDAAVPRRAAVIEGTLRTIPVLAVVIDDQAGAEMGRRAVTISGRLMIIVTIF